MQFYTIRIITYKGPHDAVFLPSSKSNGQSLVLSQECTSNDSLSKKLKLVGNNSWLQNTCSMSGQSQAPITQPAYRF